MDATDIVEVVKEFVTLKKQGVNYKGLCPFHNDRTPSFTVSPAKQLCKCFSCGKGGNAVHFLMEIEQMSYTDAIKWLGKKYNIEVKERVLSDEEKAAQTLRESLFVVNEWANKYFRRHLTESVEGVSKGLAYFRSRGFRDDTIEKFQLGFGLSERDDMAKNALSAGFNEEFLIKTGVCFKADDGRLLDRYHGRVIFPIFTVSGKVVAFGGRILGNDKKTAKYVNSPESEIYSKSRELYGLYHAKSAIVREGRCFLVEGYTDVISMHQCGVENVVASSGTSLTEGQIRLIHRFTNNITVLYDGDAAGIKASLRGIDMLLAEGLNIKVLLLPDGEDPDSFARKHRAEEFRAYIEEKQVDFIRFKTQLLMKDAADDPIKRAELVSDIVRSIAVIPDNVVRQMYITECAVSLRLSEELVVNEINKQHRKLHSDPSPAPSDDAKDEANKEEAKTSESASSLVTSLEVREERLLMTMVLRFGECRMFAATEDEQSKSPSDEPATVSVAGYIYDSLTADGLQLSSPIYRAILEEAVSAAEESDNWEALPYFTRHANPDISRLAVTLGEDRHELSTNQRAQYTEDRYRLDEMVPRLLHDYKHSLIKARLKELLKELQSPALQSDMSRAEIVMKEFMELSAIERQFAAVLGDRVVLK